MSLVRVCFQPMPRTRYIDSSPRAFELFPRMIHGQKTISNACKARYVIGNRHNERARDGFIHGAKIHPPYRHRITFRI